MTDPDAEFADLAAISAKKRSFDTLEPNLKRDVADYCEQVTLEQFTKTCVPFLQCP